MAVVMVALLADSRFDSRTIDVKKTYVGATHDRAVPPALQRVLAERAGAAFQMIDSDHSPFYSARADLIRILLDHG